MMYDWLNHDWTQVYFAVCSTCNVNDTMLCVNCGAKSCNNCQYNESDCSK